MSVDDETLRTWARGVNRMAIAKMAEDHPDVRKVSKDELIDWLMANDRAILAESYRIETEAFARLRERR